MKEDLDKKLCDEFPNLYRERNLSRQETCMCWGFPDDGWFGIIYELSKKLEPLCDPSPDGMRAVQVKEKFGTLRFYIEGGTVEQRDEANDLIEDAERESAVTCEMCGGVGRRLPGGWIKTLCDVCDSNKKNSWKETNE